MYQGIATLLTFLCIFRWGASCTRCFSIRLCCCLDDVSQAAKRRYYLSAHWLNSDVLLSNSAFLIFAVLLAWFSHSRPCKMFLTVMFLQFKTLKPNWPQSHDFGPTLASTSYPYLNLTPWPWPSCHWHFTEAQAITYHSITCCLLSICHNAVGTIKCE